MAKENSPKTYAKLSTEFYDLDDHKNHQEALDFYIKLACNANGPILEPMCGSGRFLIPMLQLGLDAQGFDASEYMIQAFKHTYARITDKPAPVWQQLIQDFSSTKKYKLIFIPYGSWGLITDQQDAKKAVETLYRYLVPGGKLVLEIETISSVSEPSGIRRRAVRTRADGSKIALTFITTYQPEIQLFSSHAYYESIINGLIQETEDELFQQYVYRFDELDSLLHEVGFKTIKKYPAFDYSRKVDEYTPIIIYECVK